MSDQITKLYRYERGYEVDSDYIHDGSIRLDIHNIMRYTEKGYWIRKGHELLGKERWVSRTGKKRYAYPTTDEALVNFVTRTEMALRYNQDAVIRSKGFLKVSNEMLKARES